MSHRTRPLHNFDLPELQWSNQRVLRCMNLPEDAGGEKMMLGLREASENMKLSMASPWNLRTRRAACRAPERERGRRDKAVVAERETVKVKFSVGLSRAEIEEDFKAMAGVRPPRRPKKRNRTVQRDLDQLFPGLGLTEITPEAYKVDVVAE